jgi:hypothetical protein
MNEPRAKTVEEMRLDILEHIKHLCDYWRTTPLGSDLDNTKWRMEGLVHSMLVMFDGGSMGIPALDIIPDPHESDMEYDRDVLGENWWTTEVINNCQLHEIWARMSDA